MQTYVFKKMYSFLFSKKELQQKDEQLNNKILKIRETLTPHQLDIRDDIDDDLIYAAGCLFGFPAPNFSKKKNFRILIWPIRLGKSLHVF